MAKLSSIFKFEGSLDDFTAIRKSGFLKRKGGLSKERIAADPKLIRVRENNLEFGNVSKASKLLRLTFIDIKRYIPHQNANYRLVSLLNAVKNLDLTSMRGLRKVALGIGNQEGKTILTGFSFNPKRSLSNAMSRSYDLDTITGNINVSNLIPNIDIHIKQRADVVGFKSYWATIDFANGLSKVSISEEIKVALNSNQHQVKLCHPAPPSGEGTHIHVLLIIYYQTVNGKDYLLQNMDSNVADIISVL